MIDDQRLDQDAQEALALDKAIVREVRDGDGHLYHRSVEPYRSDIGGVVVTYTPVDTGHLAGHVEFKAKTNRDSELASEDVVRSLTMGMTQIGVWTLDTKSSHLDWDERFGKITGLSPVNLPMSQSGFLEQIHERDRAAFEEGLQAVIDGGEPQDTELRYYPPERPMMWLQVRSMRVKKNGAAMVVGIIADITERKESTERSDFMMRELDHRVKNLLAIILSIAEITARSNDDIDSYKNDFRGRLESMARTHNLLAQTQWAGSDFRSLVEQEVRSLAPCDTVTIEGPDLDISPAAAQSLAMFLHELVINALKHGALSQAGGQVSVRWENLSAVPGVGKALRLVWEESGGPLVSEPAREGFGGKVINRIVKRQLHADVTTQWKAEGVKLTAVVPKTSIAATPRDDSLNG
ncbi:MAG: HWE histidine kinase domain-containing protein [Pseudomonadota bacterium]